MTDQSEPQIISDSRDAAKAAGLVYASSDEPGFTRKRAGKAFSYRDVNGAVIRDAAMISRIKALAIPPAWTGVWICSNPAGHIQAVGFDERGRKQYRYHPKFREAREGAKFEHILGFAEALPSIRERIAADMAKRGLGREKVLATVVHLLETTMIRVGNAAYAKDNKSYGLTTLLNRHVKVEGSDLKFHFKGKSGKVWKLNVKDRRVAHTIKSCQDLPGQHLFQYVDDGERRQTVTSTDVNTYLRDISGAEITAKDFRTWAGTVLAAMALNEVEAFESQAQGKRNVTWAIADVASRLGNTPTICRKCYIHPEIVTAYLERALQLEIGHGADQQLVDAIKSLQPEETAVLAFLHARASGKSTSHKAVNGELDASRRRPRRGRKSTETVTEPSQGDMIAAG